MIQILFDENISLPEKYSQQKLFEDERAKHLNDLLERPYNSDEEYDDTDNDNNNDTNNKREKIGNDSKPWKLGYS